MRSTRMMSREGRGDLRRAQWAGERGLRDFRVVDPKGNPITFDQPLWVSGVVTERRDRDR